MDRQLRVALSTWKTIIMFVQRNAQRLKTTKLTHLTPDGAARMVDVGTKPVTRRTAVAEARIDLGPEMADLLRSGGNVSKGDVIETARLAGIQAAKKTAELIPLCHPLALDVVELSAEVEQSFVRLEARVAAHGRTGVEMEAMTAVSVAALTVYDMVKSAGKGVTIGPIRLLMKTGGKSGQWKR